MPEMTMIQAIRDALRLELERDPNVLVFGEDVGGYGGVFRVTEGLQAQFGETRVFDTPLAESAIGGLAVGLAATGFRPVAEVQFFGFVLKMFDEVNHIARMNFRYRGRHPAPIVIRAPFGGGVRAAEHHSDSLEGLLLATPGLKVVIPSNPYDAKGLLISAIRDDDPVIFLEHMKLYRSFRAEVPAGAYTVPLGKARLVREGEDVTVIAYGAMVQAAEKAAAIVAEEDGLSVEILDLRTVWPLDREAILASVAKTNRAVVVQEAQAQAGAAAEIIAQIMEHGVYFLEAPVRRVAAPNTPYPLAQHEDDWLPSPEAIAAAIREVAEA
ncbi:alpha-ketoacid dehydrogenase subunit beta [Hydrogenibacillus schlegelii]|nr:alpha-ketoacid dehydrogenase subunit beta [Hydrogenibacillus schlegelii]KWX06839.1 2-oxoisovalerate dehydrogenase [Hydrogenibacillus schlegelii]MBT9283435.1 alpha-ketoacid dehydrogenase subunit beta [Hydrogenibacillus schlegelii]OAR04299.1 2-oxoisovalerate dehydrogenase [Hydrogenibacillus schlegelii]